MMSAFITLTLCGTLYCNPIVIFTANIISLEERSQMCDTKVKVELKFNQPVCVEETLDQILDKIGR